MRRFLALMLLFTCGCNGDHSATGPSSNVGMIRGVVTDFETHSGIAGVAVLFTAETTGREQVTTITDANGAYSVATPGSGYYQVSIGSSSAGVIRITPRSRGDLYVDRGSCVARYGVITDANTGASVAGATVTLDGATAVTAADGWYRLDLGCPDSGSIGINTTFVYVTHPDYTTGQVIAGRGVQGVMRKDIGLSHR